MTKTLIITGILLVAIMLTVTACYPIGKAGAWVSKEDIAPKKEGK